MPVEELLVLGVEIFGLLLRIVEPIGDIRRRVVPESRALPVLAVALAAACGPIQSSAIAGEGVDVGVDLAGQNDVADLVGLRYDVGVERLETLIDYCVEVRNLARQRGVFNEGEKTGEVIFGFSKGGRVVGFELCD